MAVSISWTARSGATHARCSAGGCGRRHSGCMVSIEGFRYQILKIWNRNRCIETVFSSGVKTET